MKHVALAMIGLLTAETAAIACSCMDTDDPAQLRSFAPDAVRNAFALVEAEAVSEFDPVRGGEQMRVIQTLAGSAPPVFKIERGPFPSGASCDVLYQQGERSVVILYPSRTGASPVPTYRTSSLCTAHLLTKPVFRDEVARLIAGRARPTERGR